MKKTIFILIFCAAAPVQAGDLYLDVNGYSWHSNETYAYRGRLEKYNSRNTGLGFTYAFNKHIEAFAGNYYNSYNRNTIYGGAKIKHDFAISDLTITSGINIGVATGYDKTPVQSDYYQLVIMPAARITYRGVGLTLGYIPRVERENFKAVSTITAQVNIRVGVF